MTSGLSEYGEYRSNAKLSVELNWEFQVGSENAIGHCGGLCWDLNFVGGMTEVPNDELRL